jgi:hypothetical protein
VPSRIRLPFQPAFGIIGDPAKRDPHTRQSADHSMVYIVSTLMRKAFEMAAAGGAGAAAIAAGNDAAWKQLRAVCPIGQRAPFAVTSTQSSQSS